MESPIFFPTSCVLDKWGNKARKKENEGGINVSDYTIVVIVE